MTIPSGPPPRRPRKDQSRNRQALIDAARAVIAERGVDAPLDVIAKRAGLGNATLYRHFPQRQHLLIEVLLVNLEDSRRVLAESLTAETGWAGFRGYLTWLFREQIDNPAYMSALRAIPAGESERVDLLRDETVRTLTRLIDRARAEGAFRHDRWIEDVFVVLAVNEGLAHRGHADPHSASRRLLEISLSGLSAAPPPDGDVPEPESVLALRRTLGHELAGLPLPVEPR